MAAGFVGRVFLPRAALGGCLCLCVVVSAAAAADDKFAIAEKASQAAIASLETELAKGELWGDKLAERDFAHVALTKDDAAKARELLWKHHAERIAKERAEEITKGKLTLDKKEMPFTLKEFGEKPKEGWSLWISMHGGGGGPKAVNDSQWENQKRLYKLEEGLYVAPRAPSDAWNMWHEQHIDGLYDRLIEDLIVLKQVDPNRVYILGYSAGGDGVYQLGPRMADRLAAAAMMAGHPNGANPLNLRNLGFAVQAGALDSAYSRNKIARQWIDKLDELQKDDPKGYVHFGKVFEGKGHWMDREDAKVLPWMASLKRNPVPERVVWRQTGDKERHARSYWLAVPESAFQGGAQVIAERAGQNIEIKSAEKIDDLLIRLDERMVNLDEPVKVVYKEQVLFNGRAPRSIGTLVRTLDHRGDPQLMFDAEVAVKVPGEK